MIYPPNYAHTRCFRVCCCDLVHADLSQILQGNIIGNIDEIGYLNESKAVNITKAQTSVRIVYRTL